MCHRMRPSTHGQIGYLQTEMRPLSCPESVQMRARKVHRAHGMKDATPMGEPLTLACEGPTRDIQGGESVGELPADGMFRARNT